MRVDWCVSSWFRMTYQKNTHLTHPALRRPAQTVTSHRRTYKSQDKLASALKRKEFCAKEKKGILFFCRFRPCKSLVNRV